MPDADLLGASQPKLVLYLPHRPNGFDPSVDTPDVQTLLAANSNHWRKILTLLAKIASPVADDWRRFKNESLFQHTALCLSPVLVNNATWHWIGGKDNLQRFEALHRSAMPLAPAPGVLLDPHRRILLTPYPDYRQLNNHLLSEIRIALRTHGFYDN